MLTLNYKYISLPIYLLLVIFVSRLHKVLPKETTTGKPKVFEAFDANYAISEKQVNWFSANRFCRQNGMTLAAPKKQAQQTRLESFLKSYRNQRISNNIWIGANYLGDEKGNYHWTTDGSMLKYTHWDKDRPKKCANCGCALIKLDVNDFKWDNDNCAMTTGFVCEFLKATGQKLE